MREIGGRSHQDCLPPAMSMDIHTGMENGIGAGALSSLLIPRHRSVMSSVLEQLYRVLWNIEHLGSDLGLGFYFL